MQASARAPPLKTPLVFRRTLHNYWVRIITANCERADGILSRHIADLQIAPVAAPNQPGPLLVGVYSMALRVSELFSTL